MVFTDHYGDDDDPDAGIGIPSEFSQRSMLAEAIVKANGIDQELRGRVSGALADYVRYAMTEAADAAAELLVSHPEDPRRIFELQKAAAGYAHVMAWIRATLMEARSNEMILNEMDEELEKDHGQEA